MAPRTHLWRVHLRGRHMEPSVSNSSTSLIEADTRHVKHFAEIAEAGRGRCVSMPAGGDVSLIAEIAGLTLGERFEIAMREFFQTYLALCR